MIDDKSVYDRDSIARLALALFVYVYLDVVR